MVFLPELHDELAEDDEDGEEKDDAGDHEAPAEEREAGWLRVLLSVAVSRRGLEVRAEPPFSPGPQLLASLPALPIISGSAQCELTGQTDDSRWRLWLWRERCS